MKKIVLWKIQFWQIYFITAFLMLIINYWKTFVYFDSDMLWHIKQGTWMLDNHKIKIDKEIFSYQFDYIEWKYLSWIADIIQAVIYSLWGFKGVIVQTAIIISSYLTVINVYLKKQRVSIVNILIFNTLIIPLLSTHWGARPVIYSHLFIVLWFIIIDLNEKNEKNKLIWFLPILNILWVNIQSSFIYGFVIIALFAGSNMIKYCLSKNIIDIKRFFRYAILGVLCVLSSFVNPFGIGYYSFYFDDVFNKKMEILFFFTSEFQTADFSSFIYFNIFVVFLFLILFLGKIKIKTSYSMFILFWFYSAFYYARHISILGIFLLLILPQVINLDIFEKWGLKEKIIDKINKFIVCKRKTLLSNLCFVASMSLIILLLSNPLFWVYFNIKPELKESFYPQNAMNYIKKNIKSGRIYNDYMIGGFMIWEFYPEKKVFIDPRASVYPIEIINYFLLLDKYKPNYAEILNYFDIEYLVLRKGTTLALGLATNNRFSIVYQDNFFIIYKWNESSKKKAEKVFGNVKYKYGGSN